jgi:hypothetical protein
MITEQPSEPFSYFFQRGAWLLAIDPRLCGGMCRPAGQRFEGSLRLRCRPAHCFKFRFVSSPLYFPPGSVFLPGLLVLKNIAAEQSNVLMQCLQCFRRKKTAPIRLNRSSNFFSLLFRHTLLYLLSHLASGQQEITETDRQGIVSSPYLSFQNVHFRTHPMAGRLNINKANNNESFELRVYNRPCLSYWP